jgi:hypothetical protein
VQEEEAQKQAKQEKAMSRYQRRKEDHKRNKQKEAVTTLKPVKIEASEWKRLRAMSYKALQMEQARAKALQAEGGAMSLQEKAFERAMQEARARVLRENARERSIAGQERATRERAQKEKKATAPQGQGRRAKFRADADLMARVDAFGEAQFNETFKSRLGNKLFMNPAYDFILPSF